MYAVIFRATVRQLDEEYIQLARQMRELATEKYGCLDIASVTEGEQEITISYWETAEQIEKWKQDEEHQKAQQEGRNKWYADYTVQVTEVKRSYQYNEA